MIGLFIGRFQPFHLGHLDAVRQILEQCDKVIIAVGSSQYKDTCLNPFSFEERKEMIEAVLGSVGIDKYDIKAVPDIHDDSMWLEHVEEIVGDYDTAYTGNPETRSFFEGIRPQVLLKFNIVINATNIRDMIAHDDPSWKNYMHPAAVKVFLKVGGIERMKKLNCAHGKPKGSSPCNRD